MNNENKLVPDFRSETVQTYTETYTPEGGTEQTATYKIGTAHPIISGILDKLAWVRTHVAAVWWNRLAGVTLKDKIDTMDESITQLNGNKVSFHPINESIGFTSTAGSVVANYKIPANSYFVLTVYGSYAYSVPKVIVISIGNSMASVGYGGTNEISATVTGYTKTETNLNVTAGYTTAGNSEAVVLRGFYITADIS